MTDISKWRLPLTYTSNLLSSVFRPVHQFFRRSSSKMNAMFKIKEDGTGDNKILYVYDAASGILVTTIRSPEKNDKVEIQKKKPKTPFAVVNQDNGYSRSNSRKTSEGKRRAVFLSPRKEYSERLRDKDRGQDSRDKLFTKTTRSSNSLNNNAVCIQCPCLIDPPPLDDECLEKSTFLEILGLREKSETTPVKKKPVEYPHCICGRFRNTSTDVSSFKNVFNIVQFSSALGKNLFSRINSTLETSLPLSPPHVTSSGVPFIPKYEHYCITPGSKERVKGHALRGYEASMAISYPITFNGMKHSTNKYAHLYLFTKPQKAERYHTLKTGLNKRSRQLKAQCNNLKIDLNRISLSDIKLYTKPAKVRHSSYASSSYDTDKQSTCGEDDLEELNVSNKFTNKISRSSSECSSDSAASSSKPFDLFNFNSPLWKGPRLRNVFQESEVHITDVCERFYYDFEGNVRVMGEKNVYLRPDILDEMGIVVDLKIRKRRYLLNNNAAPRRDLKLLSPNHRMRLWSPTTTSSQNGFYIESPVKQSVQDIDDDDDIICIFQSSSAGSKWESFNRHTLSDDYGSSQNEKFTKYSSASFDNQGMVSNKLVDKYVAFTSGKRHRRPSEDACFTPPKVPRREERYDTNENFQNSASLRNGCDYSNGFSRNCRRNISSALTSSLTSFNSQKGCWNPCESSENHYKVPRDEASFNRTISFVESIPDGEVDGRVAHSNKVSDKLKCTRSLFSANNQILSENFTNPHKCCIFQCQGCRLKEIYPSENIKLNIDHKVKEVSFIAREENCGSHNVCMIEALKPSTGFSEFSIDKTVSVSDHGYYLL